MNPFKWDGSYLGVISDVNIIRKYAMGNRDYWDITIDNYRTVCMIKKRKDCTPCILDEFKSLFGLTKIGTHYVKYGIKIIILSQCRLTAEGTVAYEHTLAELKGKVDISTELLFKIRAIYVFRDLFKVSKTNETHIILRIPLESGLRSYPVSFNEGSIKLEKIDNFSTPSTISDVCHKKWFRDEIYGKIYNINELLIPMCKAFTGDTSLMIMKLKEQMVDICERISHGNYTHIADVVAKALVPRLRSIILDPKDIIPTYTGYYTDDEIVSE